MMPLVRRSLALTIAALLVAIFAVAGTSAPAGAAASASLKIVSVTDTGTGLAWPVQNRPFNVEVAVVNAAGKPTTVTAATTIRLTASGPGGLTADSPTTAIIPANGSSATISGAKYAPYANGVVLTISADPGGTRLTSAKVTVEVAVTAHSETAIEDTALTVTDNNCIEPTDKVPTCGQLVLPNGAQAGSKVILSIGSCDGLANCRGSGTAEALVVTAIANLKKLSGEPLYTATDPATAIVACDKTVCRDTANGVPKLPVIYTLNNTGGLTETADPCPSKGTIGPGQNVCVDYVQSRRQDGDLYSYVLFDYDLRLSHP